MFLLTSVTSSSLVTLAKSHNFQALCFLPFFKAGQGFETYLINFPTTITQRLYKPFTTLLQLKSGDFWRLNTRDPLDILGVYAYILIINANIGE